MTSARLHLPYVVASFGIPVLLVAAAARLATRDTQPDPDTAGAAAAAAAPRCPHCGVALGHGDGERVSGAAGYRPSPGAATASSARMD